MTDSETSRPQMTDTAKTTVDLPLHTKKSSAPLVPATESLVTTIPPDSPSTSPSTTPMQTILNLDSPSLAPAPAAAATPGSFPSSCSSMSLPLPPQWPSMTAPRSPMVIAPSRCLGGSPSSCFPRIRSSVPQFPLRIGMIYILSALFGSVVGALFVHDGPAVSSSAALFGLLGAMISSLVRNWKLYAGKCAAIVLISTILVVNFILGLLPYVDNFSSLGGLVVGTLLGFVLLYAPKNRKFNHYKGGLFEFDTKTSSMKLNQKLDKTVMRIVSLLLFVLLASGSVALVIRGTDVNKYCSWCQYADCVPSTRWSCQARAASCEAIETGDGWTLTCESNGNYKVLPYADLSRARMEDLCSLICT